MSMHRSSCFRPTLLRTLFVTAHFASARTGREKINKKMVLNWNRPPQVRRRHSPSVRRTLSASRFPFLFRSSSSGRCIFVGIFHSHQAESAEYGVTLQRISPHVSHQCQPTRRVSLLLCVRPQFCVRKFLHAAVCVLFLTAEDVSQKKQRRECQQQICLQLTCTKWRVRR